MDVSRNLETLPVNYQNGEWMAACAVADWRAFFETVPALSQQRLEARLAEENKHEPTGL